MTDPARYFLVTDLKPIFHNGWATRFEFSVMGVKFEVQDGIIHMSWSKCRTCGIELHDPFGPQCQPCLLAKAPVEVLGYGLTGTSPFFNEELVTGFLEDCGMNGLESHLAAHDLISDLTALKALPFRDRPLIMTQWGLRRLYARYLTELAEAAEAADLPTEHLRSASPRG